MWCQPGHGRRLGSYRRCTSSLHWLQSRALQNRCCRSKPNYQLMVGRKSRVLTPLLHSLESIQAQPTLHHLLYSCLSCSWARKLSSPLDVNNGPRRRSQGRDVAVCAHVLESCVKAQRTVGRNRLVCGDVSAASAVRRAVFRSRGAVFSWRSRDPRVISGVPAVLSTVCTEIALG